MDTDSVAYHKCAKKNVVLGLVCCSAGDQRDLNGRISDQKHGGLDLHGGEGTAAGLMSGEAWTHPVVRQRSGQAFWSPQRSATAVQVQLHRSALPICSEREACASQFDSLLCAQISLCFLKKRYALQRHDLRHRASLLSPSAEVPLWRFK
jgi:hypothetical protein